MKKLPIGIQSFEIMREKLDEYVYIDKTKILYDIATQGRVYFLSRPRRFGKSLTCSTLEAMFTGRKDLFKGLWIEQSDWEWEEHPVIHISMGTIAKSDSDVLYKDLCEEVLDIARHYGLKLDANLALSRLFKNLIEKLSKRNKVVIIIDEYDKPILDHVTNPEVAHKIRSIVQDFYGIIKDSDQYIKFVFITGVTKFVKTSIFSGLNNLKDISLDSRFATLVGYTKKEIVNNFDEYLKIAAKKQKLPIKELLVKIEYWYNGYCFSDEVDEVNEAGEKIYNPFSVLLFLDKKKFENYWFETGTPTFLINLIKQNNYPLLEMNHAIVNSADMNEFEIDALKFIPLMYQSGYLTIKDYDFDTMNFSLTYPNHEVRLSLTQHLVEAITSYSKAQISNYVIWFRKALEQDDLEHFCKTLHDFFTQIPYTLHLEKEKSFHALFFVIVRLIHANVDVEVPTNTGRIDAVIEMPNNIYIFEFKYAKKTITALEQIQNKKYFEKFLHKKKPVTLIGLSFNIDKKNIKSDWLIKKL